MTHILLYSDRPGIYGAEQCNHAIICDLATAGHETTLVQPPANHHLVADRAAQGVRQRWLAPDDIYDLRQPARALTDDQEPRRILAEAAPDFIIFSDSSPLSNLKAKQVAGELGIPYLVVVHCVNPEWADDYRAYLPALPPLYARATTVVAVSAANLRLLRERFGLPADRGQVIYNGRPAAFFAPPDQLARERIRRDLGLTDETVLCLTVARLAFSKGYQYQLEALRRLRDCPAYDRLHFAWVGDGELGAKLARYLRLVGAADRVHLLGERQDIPALLDAADVFVLPSQFEGLPLVIMEAMAKGLPIVATAVSGTPEAVGNAGVLVPDPQQHADVPARLASAICDLAQDPDRRAEMGARARARARGRFEARHMLAAYRTLVSRSLNGHE